VLVLKARDRVGGRVHTVAHDGIEFELGRCSSDRSDPDLRSRRLRPQGTCARRTAPPNTSPGRDRALDQLLVFLESLRYAEPLIARSPLSRENAGRRTPTRHNPRLGIARIIRSSG